MSLLNSKNIWPIIIGLFVFNAVCYAQVSADTLDVNHQYIGVIELPPLLELIEDAYYNSPLNKILDNN